MGLSTEPLSVFTTWHLIPFKRSDPKENIAEAAMSFVTQPQKSHTHSQYLTDYIGQPYSVWKETPQGMNARRQEPLEAILESGFYTTHIPY